MSTPRDRMPKRPKKEEHEKGRLRSSFVRLFDKYHLYNEQQFETFVKWLIFIILLLVEVLILGQHIYAFNANGGWGALTVIIITETVLTITETLKLFIVKKGRKIRGLFYALSALAACVFMFVTSGNYPVILYMLVLTELYVATKRSFPRIMEFSIALLLYEVSYLFHAYVDPQGISPDIVQIVIQSFSYVVMLAVHFVIAQIVLAFYSQYLRLNKALKELDESKRELEKAYAVVAEVTALEERQRIAREIHDTAGHSVTTVIMQTESAKLIIDNDPQEAKNKIIAANLQAKHALEELRDSVHLLSGVRENQTLKTSLENVIHESTDGTGITIRSEIADVRVSSAKFRFLINSLKEGISNGLRHGGATAFWFELKLSDGRIEFLLSDNGKGADIKTLEEGYGLSGMRERARALGGELTVDAEENEGLEIRLDLPADTAEE